MNLISAKQSLNLYENLNFVDILEMDFFDSLVTCCQRIFSGAPWNQYYFYDDLYQKISELLARKGAFCNLLVDSYSQSIVGFFFAEVCELNEAIQLIEKSLCEFEIIDQQFSEYLNNRLNSLHCHSHALHVHEIGIFEEFRGGANVWKLFKNGLDVAAKEAQNQMIFWTLKDETVYKIAKYFDFDEISFSYLDRATIMFSLNICPILNLSDSQAEKFLHQLRKGTKVL